MRIEPLRANRVCETLAHCAAEIRVARERGLPYWRALYERKRVQLEAILKALKRAENVGA